MFMIAVIRRYVCSGVGGALDDLQPTIEMFHRCSATFDPVAAIHIE